MKILIIGIFSFFGWSTLSTYVYVCKIKELCDAPLSILISEASTKNLLVTDTFPKPLAKEQLTVPEDLIIYFAFDKSEFDPNSITNNYFIESKAYLKQNKHARIEIKGHTDAIGTNLYNDALGYQRAQSVQYYFKNKGLAGNFIKIKSLGEKQPVDNNETAEGRASNRRTVITFK